MRKPQPRALGIQGIVLAVGLGLLALWGCGDDGGLLLGGPVGVPPATNPPTTPAPPPP